MVQAFPALGDNVSGIKYPERPSLYKKSQLIQNDTFILTKYPFSQNGKIYSNPILKNELSHF